MKSAHSIRHDRINKILVLANTEMLKCDLQLEVDSEEIAQMAQSIIIEPGAILANAKEPCLLQAANAVNHSGLTNGYSVTLNDIKGIVFYSHMVEVILENLNSDVEQRHAQNFFNDLADGAGHHVQMFGIDSLDYFNEKIPFEHYISTSELRLLFYYFCFATYLLEWEDDMF